MDGNAELLKINDIDIHSMIHRIIGINDVIFKRRGICLLLCWKCLIIENRFNSIMPVVIINHHAVSLIIVVVSVSLLKFAMGGNQMYTMYLLVIDVT